MADEKLTELNENSSPAAADGFYIVDGFGGSPVSEYITFDNLLNGGDITVLGTITSGDADAAVSAASLTVAGKIEVATAAETDTGTDATRALSPDGFQGSKRNIRYLIISLVDSATDVAADTDIGGDFVIPFAGTILQSDSLKNQLYAKTDTAGTTGTMVVDIHLNGTTIMDTNKLDIDTTKKDTQNSATQPDLTTTAISAGDILTFDIDAVHTTEAKGLKVGVAIRED